MNIVLNEKKWAEQAMTEGRLFDSPIETQSRIAKYYYSQGQGKKDVTDKVSEYIEKCDPSASSTLWSETVERIVKYAAKTPIITINKITITDKELKAIDSLRGKQEQRLAFTLLCIAKYNNLLNKENSYWVSTPDREVMKMANINTSIKRQSKMFHDLRESGMLKFSKRVDSLSVQVQYADDTGSPELDVTDFRNLGYQYMSRGSKSFYRCERCGLIEKSLSSDMGRPKKYCPECAKKVKRDQDARAVRKFRSIPTFTQ